MHVIRLISLPEIGNQMICERCCTRLEVIWLFPVILDFQEYEIEPASDQDKNFE
jgi:hypothetical protein